MIKIAVDVMGAELGPGVVIKGAKLFLNNNKNNKNNVIFYFVGDEEKIKKLVIKFKISDKNYKIIPTTEIITQKDSVLAIRRKKNSSMIKAISLTNEGVCDGVISGGPTPNFLAASHIYIKEIKGIKRPDLLG